MPFPIEWFALGVLAGYLLGRVDTLVGVLRGRAAPEPVSSPQLSSFFAKKRDTSAPVSRPPVQIDETKVVSQLDTATLQKVTETPLGRTTVVSDDVAAAASRLANLKGKT